MCISVPTVYVFRTIPEEDGNTDQNDPCVYRAEAVSGF